jgi:hypothetical protein
MNDLSKNAILAELEELIQAETMQPNDLTIKDLEEVFIMHRANVYNKIRRLVKQGYFTEHRVRPPLGGKVVTVWRRTNKPFSLDKVIK